MRYFAIILFFSTMLNIVGSSTDVNNSAGDINLRSTVNSTDNEKEHYYKKVWDSITGDVNGDGKKEVLELVGDAIEGNNIHCYSKLLLIIKDADTNEILSEKLLDWGGYHPRIQIGDINRDGGQEILIRADSGGNKWGHIYYSLLSFKDNVFKEINLDSIRQGYDQGFHIELLADDQIIVWFDEYNERFILPLSRLQSVYYKKIADKEKSGFGGFASYGFSIEDVNGDGTEELICDKIMLSDYYHAIASVNIVYRLEEDNFYILDVSFKPYYKMKSKSDKEKFLRKSDLKLGPLTHGMSYEDAIKILGNPVTDDHVTRTFQDGTQIGKSSKLYYFDVSNENYETPRGLKVGDSMEKVKVLYGEPDEDTSDSSGQSWEYYTDDLDTMRFYFENGKVYRIGISHEVI